MTPLIREADSVAVIGRGTALSVYKWLMHKGFTGAGQFDHDLETQDNYESIGEGFRRKQPELTNRPIDLELDTFWGHVDVLLLEISPRLINYSYVENEIGRYKEKNQNIKIIFFPSLSLPKRRDVGALSRFTEYVDGYLKSIDLFHKICKNFVNVDFFPAYQIIFYLGIRSEVENGKNSSLEFIHLALELFRKNYFFEEKSYKRRERDSGNLVVDGDFDFIGDSHILNILESVGSPKASRSLLMSGSEWDSQNFHFTNSYVQITPKHSEALSDKSVLNLPNDAGRVLITNIGTHSHCLYERLVEAMKMNNVTESDLNFPNFVNEAVKYYRTKHIKLLANLRNYYHKIIVVSDPPFQHFRIYEDGRKYENIYRLIDEVLQRYFESVGCNFLNLRKAVGKNGRVYDFLSNKTLSPTSDEMDWVHGNTMYYKFVWQKVKGLAFSL